MSFKCLTLCTLVLLLAIDATWAEGSKTLQPRPEQQLRQSKDLRYGNEQLYSLDDEDGDDIVEDEADELDGEFAQDERDVAQLDNASIDELTKLINELEAQEKIQSRATRARGGKRSSKRRNRSGSNKRRNRNSSNKRQGSQSKRRNNRRGNAYRDGGNKRNRNAPRRKSGAKRVYRQ